MDIDVFLVPSGISNAELRSKTCVVIDVLRTSSSLLQALKNGCREVIPVESVERALALHSTLFDSNVLLCGERDGVKIEGFQLGNSPHEYSEEIVKDKSIIFTSTNGTAAFQKTKNCSSVYLCGFQNIDKISGIIADKDDGVMILCAGHENRFALEDTTCAGMLVKKIINLNPGDVLLSDAAQVALLVYESYADNLNKMIYKAKHGANLIQLGMEKDLDFCIQTNTIPLAPEYKEGKISLTE